MSNVCHVPKPITGSSSREDGISSVMIGSAPLGSAEDALLKPASASAALPAGIMRTTSRLLILRLAHFFLDVSEDARLAPSLVS